MKDELNIFFSAVRYFTRIPVSSRIEHSQNSLNETMRYFPLIGWIVGGLSGLVFYGANQFWPVSISVVFSMIVSVFLTGAFHEDGLADVCDGFGGGWNKSQILAIMKDSRIGTYGIISLILIVLLKYSLLVHMPVRSIPIVLIAGHSLSRFAVVLSILFMPNVQTNQSKDKPNADKMSLLNVLFAAIFGFIPLVLINVPILYLSVLPMFIVVFGLVRYFKKRIGGYTGDCLGSIQQISEVVFYSVFILL